MAQICIGGVTESVTLENYTKLKAAWKYIEAAQGTTDFAAGMDAVIGAIAVGALPSRASEADIAAKAADLGDRLTGQEIPTLKPFMNELLIEAGLAEKPGEPVAVAANPSTETSTPSSPS